MTEAINKKLENLKMPKHIAFIMDGNGRWAKNRGLPRKKGHVEGVEAMKRVLNRCNELGIECVSVFAFSTENWNRPQEEVDGIMNLLVKMFKSDGKTFVKNNVKVRHMGDIYASVVPQKVKKAFLDIEEKTKNCTGSVFNVGFNYGGRADIVQAVNKIISEKKNEIDEKEFNSYLYTAGLPDPDLIVRTSGEQRISNFMIWQMAYSEFSFVMDKHWPDFCGDDVDDLIVEFNKRNRRFGAIKE